MNVVVGIVFEVQNSRTTTTNVFQTPIFHFKSHLFTIPFHSETEKPKITAKKPSQIKLTHVKSLLPQFKGSSFVN